MFIGANDGFLYALDSSNGSLIWEIKIDGMVRSTPIVWKNLVFIGSDDGYLTALDQNFGDIIWRYRTGDAIVAGPIIYDSKLYVGSLDRRVHAFQLEQIIQNGN